MVPYASFAPSISPVHAFYLRKVRRFGATPIGADWTYVASQGIPLVQLLKLCQLLGVLLS